MNAARKDGSLAAQIDRVRKLLRLAQSPNIHEAASAKERADALMAQHRLTHADVAEDVFQIADDQSPTERRELARVVSSALGCSAVVSKRGGLAFKGRREVVSSAVETYKAFVAEGARSCRMPSADAPQVAHEAWRICFWIGLVGAAADQLFGIRRNPVTSGASQVESVSREAAPSTVKEALTSLETLGEYLDGAVEDVQAVIDRLRKSAYEAGQQAGFSVIYKRPADRPLLGGGQ